jgi:uncharacterized protein
MTFKTFVGVLMLAAGTLVAGVASAQEPTIDQVYKAADAGNFSQAQRMMDEVLRAHPNSAKAHYVEAELLARQGRMSAAAAELSNAQKLEPGLPFAKPQAVQELQRRIAAPQAPSSSYLPSAMTGSSMPSTGGGIPWGTLLIGAAIIALVVFAIQAMRRRNATYIPAGAPAGYGNAAPMQPYGNPGPGGVGPFGGGGGIGSGILGGLATGAALGAGMVAGEALAHRIGGGGDHAGGAIPIPGGDPGQFVPNDMGGNDFGISDSSSWDDGGGVSGGGGGSDWT